MWVGKLPTIISWLSFHVILNVAEGQVRYELEPEETMNGYDLATNPGKGQPHAGFS